MTDPNYEPRFDQPEKSTPSLQTELQKQYDDCEPKPILLLVAFKLIPATLYLILKLATNIPMLTFILTMLLVCVDFWITKNFFGWKLAGLRWYIKTVQKEDKWISESSQTRVAATINLVAFWGLQLLAMLFWVSIGLINLLTLSPMWVFLGFFCCVLLFLNFIFFMNCKGGHQRTCNAITSKLGMQLFEVRQEKI